MAVANQIFFSGEHTVDGRNPAPPGTWDVKNPKNNGTNNQPQLVIAGFLPSTVFLGSSFDFGGNPNTMGRSFLGEQKGVGRPLHSP